jgi:hypothetical protein
MSRNKIVSVKCNDACTGCELVYEQVPRSLHVREIWGQLSPACDAEEKAFRAEARRDYEARARERALIEEFT